MQTRFHTLCAAFTEICWPQMARESVMNASPRRIMNTLGWRFMIAAITGSRFASARLARFQYSGGFMPPLGSGFMQRKIDEQVLRLHLHHAILAGQRQVDGPAANVGAHQRRVLEPEGEDREDVAHAALLDM